MQAGLPGPVLNLPGPGPYGQKILLHVTPAAQQTVTSKRLAIMGVG